MTSPAREGSGLWAGRGTKTSPALHSVLALALVLSSACATIDTSSEVTIQPRAGFPIVIGNEQLVARDLVADYVQIGPRVSVELHEHRSCVRPRHVPVLRIEHIHRSNRNFVVWDFTLAALSGAFGSLAFARPQMFSNRLVDGQGRELYDNTGAYVVGGVFTTLGAGLLAIGIVDAIRSRDTSHYADAFELELGPTYACGGDDPQQGQVLRERAVELRVAADQIVLEGTTDERGRVRFELPEWTDELPAAGHVPAVLSIAPAVPGDAPRLLVFPLWVPYDGLDVQAGVVDTRRPQPQASGPIELPTSSESP